MSSSSQSYVGIDVGLHNFSAAVCGARPKEFRHDSVGVRQMLHWAARHVPGELRAVCESSGPYSLKLAGLLSQQGVSCAIVPPQRVRANAAALGRRCKTDNIDAQVILDYAMHAKPQPWVSPPPEQQKLAALLAARDDLKAEGRRWKNRLHALEQIPGTPPEALDLYTRLIANLKAEHKALLQPIKELLRDCVELRQRYRLLTGIPGIGPEIALALLARADIVLSRSDKELTAYAGLAPQHRQSGSSLRGKSRIGRAGDSKLRTLLYMGSLSAAVCNPPLQEHYQRLRDRGMPATPAHIAVARKLLLQARSVMRSGQPFTPHLKPPQN